MQLWLEHFGALPLVFRPQINLYATATLAGAVAFVAREYLWPNQPMAIVVRTGLILALRLAGIRLRLSPPVLERTGTDEKQPL